MDTEVLELELGLELEQQAWGKQESIDMHEGVTVRHLIVDPSERLPLVANGDFPLHLVIVKGTCRFHLESTDSLAENGSAVFVPPKTRYAISNVGEEVLRIVAVHYGKERKEKAAGPLSALRRFGQGSMVAVAE